MSDYMFMLESHLGAEQNKVVVAAEAAARDAGVNLFLTGGAMRDMLGGFQIRDLDFTVEGNALKLVKALVAKHGAKTLSTDEYQRSAELLFPNGVTLQVAMSRKARYGKPGTKPHVAPATIQEDLRGRDFTVNAIALSLNRASRGLLLDPMNGLADLERRELRNLHAYSFYDDPSRLFRLHRLRCRLGFTVEERTQQQYDNARAAEMEKYIPQQTLGEELRHIAQEPNPSEVIQSLESERLLHLVSAALTGPKLNLTGLKKLEKIRHLLLPNIMEPFGNLASFLSVLTEKLNPREKGALVQNVQMRRADVLQWHKLDARAKKLESALKSARLRQASQVYQVCSQAREDELVILLYRSPVKLVQDRIKNYLQKYLLAAMEITDAQVTDLGLKPGSQKFEKAKQDLIARRLDSRIRKTLPADAAAAVPVPGT